MGPSSTTFLALFAFSFFIVARALQRGRSLEDISKVGDDFYTIEYCSQYLCSDYKTEMMAYFQSGCEANFTSLLPTDDDDVSTVTGASLLFLSLCSFLSALVAGVVLGKNAKLVRV